MKEMAEKSKTIKGLKATLDTESSRRKELVTTLPEYCEWEKKVLNKKLKNSLKIMWKGDNYDWQLITQLKILSP